MIKLKTLLQEASDFEKTYKQSIILFWKAMNKGPVAGLNSAQMAFGPTRSNPNSKIKKPKTYTRMNNGVGSVIEAYAHGVPFKMYIELMPSQNKPGTAIHVELVTDNLSYKAKGFVPMKTEVLGNTIVDGETPIEIVSELNYLFGDLYYNRYRKEKSNAY